MNRRILEQNLCSVLSTQMLHSPGLRSKFLHLIIGVHHTHHMFVEIRPPEAPIDQDFLRINVKHQMYHDAFSWRKSDPIGSSYCFACPS